MDALAFQTEFSGFLHPTAKPGTWGSLESLASGDCPSRLYSVVDHLGAGAFGDVFLAVDEAMGWPVALKMLHPGRLSPTVSTAFDTERKLCRTLSRSSKWIVDWRDDGVFESPAGDKRPYLAMEYVNGRTLRELLILWHRLPQLEVVRIALEICECFLVLHEHSPSVLHRDLKPANILIDPMSGGEVRLADLGVATYFDRTRLSDVAGTLPYMAPEKLIDRTESVQSELYSLGVVIYEMLTGKRPWDLTDVRNCFGLNAPTRDQVARRDAFIARWTSTTPVMPHLIVPGIDQRLSELCIHLLQPLPQERPGSASWVKLTLERILDRVAAAGEPCPAANWPQASTADVADNIRSTASARLQISAAWLKSRSGLAVGFAESVRMSLELNERIADSKMQVQKMLKSLAASWKGDFGGRGGKEARASAQQIFKVATAFAKRYKGLLIHLPQFQLVIKEWESSVTHLHDKCGDAISAGDAVDFEAVLYTCRSRLMCAERMS